MGDNAEIFGTGDIVRLASETKRMTVDHIDDEGFVVCSWLKTDDDGVDAPFHPRMLVLIKRFGE